MFTIGMAFIAVFLYFLILQFCTSQGRRIRDISTSPEQPEDQKHIPKAMTTSNYFPTSKWSRFAACGYRNFSKENTLTKTEELFRKYFQHNYIKVEDLYDCSLNCLSVKGMHYFIFAKSLCHCMKELNESLDENRPECLVKCRNSANGYCQNGDGLAVFALDNSTKEDGFAGQSQSLDIQLKNLHQPNCLMNKSGKYELNLQQRCDELLSNNEKCGDIKDLIIPNSSKGFVQWVCQTNIRNEHYWLFRTIQRHTNNNPTVVHDLSTSITATLSFFSGLENDNTITKPDFKKQGTLDAIHSDSKQGTLDAIHSDNYAIIIGNVVLVSVTVVVLMAYGGLSIRLKIRIGLSAHKRNEMLQSRIREDSYNDRISFVPISSTVQINNEIYSEVDVSNQHPIQINNDLRKVADPSSTRPVQAKNQMYSDVDASNFCPKNISNEIYGIVHERSSM